MLYLLVKASLSGIIIAIVSEVAKRYPGGVALIASLPLVSVLGMIWLWRDKPDVPNMAAHVEATFWFVLPSLPMFLLTFISINLLLMLFNLIPLAPLDGDKIFDYFLPPSFARSWAAIRPYGPVILLAIVFVGPMLNLNILGWIIGRPMQILLSALVG